MAMGRKRWRRRRLKFIFAEMHRVPSRQDIPADAAFRNYARSAVAIRNVENGHRRPLYPQLVQLQQCTRQIATFR